MRIPHLWLLGAAFLLALGGCSTEFPKSQYPPCERPEADPVCGSPCTDDADCGAGFYCTADSVCTADCDGVADYCGSGRQCDEQGRCVDLPGVDAGPDAASDAGADAAVDAGGDAEVTDAGPCTGTVTATVHPVIPVIHFAISQSGTMATNFDQGQSRWESTTAALVDGTSGVVTRLEARALFGATLFTSHGGTAGGTCPELTQESPALNARAAIDALLSGNTPEQDSPVADTIDQVSADLLALPDLPDNPDPPKAIVLVVDDEPDTCAEPAPQNGHGDALVVVEDAFIAGIRTFVVAVDNDYDAVLLQELANVGIGLPPGDPQSAQYWLAMGNGGLRTGVDGAVRASRSCEVRLDESVDLSRADEGSVTLSSNTLPHGTGWEMADTNTVRFLGAACTAYLDDPAPTVDVEFPCDAITAP